MAFMKLENDPKGYKWHCTRCHKKETHGAAVLKVRCNKCNRWMWWSRIL